MLRPGRWPCETDWPAGGEFSGVVFSGRYPPFRDMDGHIASVVLWHNRPEQPLVLMQAEAYPVYTDPIIILHHCTGFEERYASAPYLVYTDLDESNEEGLRWRDRTMQMGCEGLPRLPLLKAAAELAANLSHFSTMGVLRYHDGMDADSLALVESAIVSYPNQWPGVAMALILALSLTQHAQYPLVPGAEGFHVDCAELATAMARSRRSRPPVFAEYWTSSMPMPWDQHHDQAR